MNPTIKLTQIADQAAVPEQWCNPIDVYKGDNGMTYVVSVYVDDYRPKEDEVLVAIAHPEYPFAREADVCLIEGTTDADAVLLDAGFRVVA